MTGSTGFVGAAVIDRAISAGHEICALARRPQQARNGLTWVTGDLADKAALERLVSDAELVIHVAGVVRSHDHKAFAEGNVKGTLNLIEAVRAVGPERFIFVSSLAARKPDISAYGASKAQAERLVMASGLDWTIVRPPAVYGPRDREMLELFRAARWGIIPIPKEGRTSLVHVDDLARLLLAMLHGNEKVSGRIFEPDDGVTAGWDHYSLALAIGHAIGKRPRVLRLSRRALERAARLDRLLRGNRAKLTLDRAAYFSHPDWVARRELVPPLDIWQPVIETRRGLAETARWYRAQRWL
ncbi:MAG: NAD(P)-dependent oxidoreductase [Novosphingobium sp.]|nr:NAD(P)-dependent oxidoreductase [Novosphingobium sp.]